MKGRIWIALWFGFTTYGVLRARAQATSALLRKIIDIIPVSEHALHEAASQAHTVAGMDA